MKFDPENLSLSNIAIIVLPAILLFFGWLWISQKPYDYEGARSIATNAHGVTHVQVDKTLFRYDQQGNELPTIDLSELGVADFLGDLTFSNDNRLLVRLGEYNPGFLERIFILFRVSNKRDIRNDSRNGLSLCDLQTRNCQPFGESGLDYNRGFFSAINKSDGSIAVSDASRHAIHLYNSAGQVVDTLVSGLEFPNEMVIDDDVLHLIDTNNKTVKQFDISDGKLVQQGRVHDLINSEAKDRGYTWPFLIEKTELYWWVVLLDAAMNNGDVYLYDKNWQFVRSLQLDDNALPVGMHSIADEVIVSDIESTVVSRYSLTGELIGTVAHEGLNHVLDENKSQRDFYKGLQMYYLLFFVLLVISILFTAIIFKQLRAKRAIENGEAIKLAEIFDISKHGDSVDWVRSQGLLGSWHTVQTIQKACLALIAVTFVIAWVACQTYLAHEFDLQNRVLVLQFAGVALLPLLFISNHSRVRLGVFQDQLVLHDQAGSKAYIAKNEAVLFDGHFISFGKLSTAASNTKLLLHDMKDITANIYPRLQFSTVLKPNAMLAWKHKNELVRLLSNVFKSLLAFAVMYQLLLTLKY